MQAWPDLVQKGTIANAAHGRPLWKYAYLFLILLEAIKLTILDVSNLDCFTHDSYLKRLWASSGSAKRLFLIHKVLKNAD